MGCTRSKPQLVKGRRRSHNLSESRQSNSSSQSLSSELQQSGTKNPKTKNRKEPATLPFLKSPKNSQHFEKLKALNQKVKLLSKPKTKSSRRSQIEEIKNALSSQQVLNMEILSMIGTLRVNQEAIKMNQQVQEKKVQIYLEKVKSKQLAEESVSTSTLLSKMGTPITFGARSPFGHRDTLKIDRSKFREYLQKNKAEKNQCSTPQLNNSTRACPIAVNNRACFNQLAKQNCKISRVTSQVFYSPKSKIFANDLSKNDFFRKVNNDTATKPIGGGGKKKATKFNVFKKQNSLASATSDLFKVRSELKRQSLAFRTVKKLDGTDQTSMVNK